MTVKIFKGGQAQARARQILWLLVVLALSGPFIVDPDSLALAQANESTWTPPINLSRSGAASKPAVIVQPDGSLRVFWWDRFDGLTTIASQGPLTGNEVWSEPEPAPIMLVEIEEGEEEPTFTPIETMPRIVGDETGQAHAFWLGEENEKTGAQPLLHSRLSVNEITGSLPITVTGSVTTTEITWSLPITVTDSAVSFDVSAGLSTTLHLAYLRGLHTTDFPAGLYYQRSRDGGTTWSEPMSLRQSRYFRRLSPETAYLRMEVDESGEVYVTWNDPHLGQATLAHLAEGATTWQVLGPVGSPEEQPRNGRVVAVPGDDVLVLWEDARIEGQCNLYQALASELQTGVTENGQRVLEDLPECSKNDQFLKSTTGQIVMIAGSGSDRLTMVAWNGEHWSEPKQFKFSFQDPDLKRQVYLDDLHAMLISKPSDPKGEAEVLLVVGSDQENDVWLTSSQIGALELAFAPSPPWSTPTNLSDDQVSLGLPVMTADVEGRVHTLWSETQVPGEPGVALFYVRGDHPANPGPHTTENSLTNSVRWTRPANVLQSPEGMADKPAMAIAGDRIHAVWQGGEREEIFYSYAFVLDAHTAQGWSEPQPLPSTAANSSWPDIAADPSGTLHIVYAVPVNAARGIYYMRSDDDGQNWSQAHQVFDAAGQGWVLVDYPRLAVDAQGTIHVTWVHGASPGGGLPKGIYHSHSTDGGQTWSEPLQIAEGAYIWPQIAVSDDGKPHLLWSEATGENTWWHAWSPDGGQGWTRPQRVQGFEDVPGPVGLIADSAGVLHLVGLGQDENKEPVLLHVTWAGLGWGYWETFHLEMDYCEPGVAITLVPSLRQLDVTFRGKATEQAETASIGLWHTARIIPTTTITLTSTFQAPIEKFHPPVESQSEALTAPPTVTQPLTTTTAPEPPLYSGDAPPPIAGGDTDTSIPLFLAGGLAILLVSGVLGIRLLWANRR